MREIVLDTETTGLDPKSGHRLCEIGCVELVNLLPTGKVFHIYINPERDVSPGAVEVHGLTWEFLRGHPTFKEQVDAFIDFIKDDNLIIHNAPFDLKFLNFELALHGRGELKRSRVTDTLKMARQMFPGSPASLDALCRRFEIDNSNRTYHGALLDSELLAAVYLELKGGRQPHLLQGDEKSGGQVFVNLTEILAQKKARDTRTFLLSKEEETAHNEFVERLDNAIWKHSSSV